eukprot:50053-Eustigmatos_ZCMA.PRE.1
MSASARDAVAEALLKLEHLDTYQESLLPLLMAAEKAYGPDILPMDMDRIKNYRDDAAGWLIFRRENYIEMSFTVWREVEDPSPILRLCIARVYAECGDIKNAIKNLQLCGMTLASARRSEIRPFDRLCLVKALETWK